MIQFRLLRSDTASVSAPGLLGRASEWIADAVGRMLGSIGAGIERVGRALRARRHPQRYAVTVRPSGASGRFREWLRTVMREVPLHIVLLPLALLFLTPLVWMFLSALTPSNYLLSRPPAVSWGHLSTSNYALLLERSPNLLRWLWNSFYLSLTVTVAQVLLSCLSGYVFAKIVFPGRRWVFAVFIASIMLPWQALIIPLFIVISTG